MMILVLVLVLSYIFVTIITKCPQDLAFAVLVSFFYISIYPVPFRFPPPSAILCDAGRFYGFGFLVGQ